MDVWTIFLLGCIGGISPEFIRMHRIVRSGFFITEEIKQSYAYIILSIILSFLGGLFAVGFNSPTIQNAIIVGVSAPLIITSQLGNNNGQ